ncbi:hypothetical protein [Mycoplasma sp. 1654_15]|uniref:hypothetical protein n=1 Tax=Mycoplasma sp. 1654_15 TaxID=2725994 RepID=UPI001448DDCD|nr:hypothetical protein [Mycoplasma sp. 1654_15]QJB71144.1 hypothetical protein HF996_01390 [Mycoplasma sp. 1654_15]
MLKLFKKIKKKNILILLTSFSIIALSSLSFIALKNRSTVNLETENVKVSDISKFSIGYKISENTKKHYSSNSDPKDQDIHISSTEILQKEAYKMINGEYPKSNEEFAKWKANLRQSYNTDIDGKDTFIIQNQETWDLWSQIYFPVLKNIIKTPDSLDKKIKEISEKIKASNTQNKSSSYFDKKDLLIYTGFSFPSNWTTFDDLPDFQVSKIKLNSKTGNLELSIITPSDLRATIRRSATSTQLPASFIFNIFVLEIEKPSQTQGQNQNLPQINQYTRIEPVFVAI